MLIAKEQHIRGIKSRSELASPPLATVPARCSPLLLWSEGTPPWFPSLARKGRTAPCCSHEDKEYPFWM